MSDVRTIDVLVDSEYRWRRDLLIDCVPEIANTLLVCVFVHPTEVYRDCTGGNVDLQLANVRHPGSPTVPPTLRVSYERMKRADRLTLQCHRNQNVC